MNVITRGMRNAFRNGIRAFSIAVILGLSIGLALTMLIARQAVSQKIDSVKSSIGNTITVSPAGARGFEGGGNPLTTAQIAQVQAIPHVSSVAQTLGDRLDSTTTNLVSSITPGAIGRRFGGGGGAFSRNATADNSNFTLPVSVTGTNSPTNTAVNGSTSVKIISGNAFDGTKDANVAIVGKDLATKNNLKVGSTFTAYATTVTVTGIYDAGNTFSNAGVIMPLPTVQRLSSQLGDVSSAVVQVDSVANLDSTVSAIESKLGSAADVVSAESAATQALAPLESIQTISFYSLVGAVVAGAAIILLTMMMIVRERRREVGVLKAIGASNAIVVLQFVTESVTFTLMGAVLGLVIGAFSAAPITKVLVTTAGSAMQGGGQQGGRGFGMLLRSAGQGGALGLRNINAVVGWDIVLYGLAAALVIAILGSAIPAFLISKVRPAEVMRAE